MNFFQPNESNVKPEIFELWRNASINDLALFLQLRANELVDNGAGLFLMVGGGSLDADKKNNQNPYGGQIADFLNGSANGSIFREAFENAAKVLIFQIHFFCNLFKTYKINRKLF